MLEMILQMDQLLWYTRGIHWDYSIICQPQQPEKLDSSALLENIFGASEAKETPVLYRGEIQYGNFSEPKTIQYIAASFLDSSKRDNDGRPISHYLVYLNINKEILAHLKVDWPRALVESLAKPYESIFKLEPKDISKDSSSIRFDIDEILRKFNEFLPKYVVIGFNNQNADNLLEWKFVNINLKTTQPKDSSPQIKTPPSQKAKWWKKFLPIVIGTGLLLTLFLFFYMRQNDSSQKPDMLINDLSIDLEEQSAIDNKPNLTSSSSPSAKQGPNSNSSH